MKAKIRYYPQGFSTLAYPRVRSVFLLLLLSFTQHVSIVVSEASSDPSSVVKPQQVLDWILLHPQAVFNEKQALRQMISEDDAEDDGEYAVHATKSIKKDEILFQVPWDLILSVPEAENKTKPISDEAESSNGPSDSGDDEEDGDESEDEEDDGDDDGDDEFDDYEMLVNCELVQLLQKRLLNHQTAQAVDNGAASLGPYLDFIIHKTKTQKKVPSTFSEVGKDVLVDILSDWAQEESSDRWRVPPAHSIFVASECTEEDSYDEDEDESGEKKEAVNKEAIFAKAATMWIVQKADNRLLIPLVHDLYPHGNGEKLSNTKIQWKEGEYYKVLASRDIDEGEILRHSLNLCLGCLMTEKGRSGSRTYETYGTAELFRDYGIIEDFPQTWILDDGSFEIDIVDGEKFGSEENKAGYTSILDIGDGRAHKISWITQVPREMEHRQELIKYLFGLQSKSVQSWRRAVNLNYPDSRDNSDMGEDDNESGDEEEDGTEVADSESGDEEEDGTEVADSESGDEEEDGTEVADSESGDEEEDGTEVADSESGDEEEDGTEEGFEFLIVPLREWDIMLKYHRAVTDAISLAYNSLASDRSQYLELSGTSTLNIEASENVCINAETCTSEKDSLNAAVSHYDDLKEEDDDLDYFTPKCDLMQWMEFTDYDAIEEVQTPYHKTLFYGDPSTGDVCMDLDTTLHICTSFRPYYNDMMVHYPARFLESVKRVLIVGGGTSMLLHEVLQYPTLEKVVGLEPDQTTTRKAFKHFRTQIHFDDDRVEWWFGDTSKGLLHLLDGYLETFDLIIINQSEIIPVDAIVQGLNTFDVLGLLLSQDGVLIKAGLHMNDLKHNFDYAVQIHYDVPKICDQSLVLVSKNVDFFHFEQIDHNVDLHYLPQLDEMDDYFDYMHDYHKNNTRHKCIWSLEKRESDSTGIQAAPYGIFRVIDFENIAESDFKIRDLLYEVAQSAILHPISMIPAVEQGTEATIVLLLEEGYIIARMWSSMKYVAVGVNLWSAYDKIPIVESNLSQRMKARMKSSFQVFVGGMNGSAHSQIIPKQSCQAPAIPETLSKVGGGGTFRPVLGEVLNLIFPPVPETSPKVVGGRGTLRPVIGEVLNLILSEQIVAGVVCGPESSQQPCIAKEVLEAHPKISQVIVLSTCPDLHGIEADSERSNFLSIMFECERNMIEQLYINSVEGGTYLDLFVVDNSAPIEMAQIFNSIWSNPKHREWYLAESIHFFLGFSLRTSDENYHRQLFDRYRRQLRYDPVNRAELLIEIDDGGRMEVDVVSVGDKYAFFNLQVVERRIQKKIGSLGRVEVQHILGGQWNQEDDEPEEFPFNTYNHDGGNEQYRLQKPLGRETILQFELGSTSASSNEMTTEKLKRHLQQALETIGHKDITTTTQTIGKNGCVIVSLDLNISVILVWHGENNIDINIFSPDRDKYIADEIVKSFSSSSGAPFILSRRDEYPRGTGRVINFAEDIVSVVEM